MTALAVPSPLTIDEFVALPDSVGYELIGGRLTQRKPLGALADYIAGQVSYELNHFVRRTKAGLVFGSETTYRCLGHPATGRRADVSFMGRGRLPGDRVPASFIDGPADVAVEVISPNDTAYAVEEEVRLYLRHGFGEVWIVYPNSRSVYVHRPDEPVLMLRGTATLTGRGPLDGFALPVAKLFPAEPA